MTTKQYTVRNVPEPVSRYLLKKSKLSGKSLNRVIIDELSEKISAPSATVGNALKWFIGSGMDEQTVKALEEEETLQKKIAQKDL